MPKIKKRILSLLMVLCLLFCLAPVSAFAVTQSEIDQIQQQKEALSAKRWESQQKVDELESRQASVLEQKAALDQRNQYALEQIQLISQQIDLYAEMIADKGKEVDAGQSPGRGAACALPGPGPGHGGERKLRLPVPHPQDLQPG